MDRMALHAASQSLAQALAAFESHVLSLPAGPERSAYLQAVQRMAHVLEMELSQPLARALESPGAEGSADRIEPSSGGSPDHGLDERLVQAIDACLLGATTFEWRRAARVVGVAVAEWPALPLAQLAHRLQSLARTGRLEARGDLANMLHSEVRLPGGL